MLTEQQSDVRWRPFGRATVGRLTHLVAALTLAAPLAALMLFWPVPHLDMTIDPATGVVLAVAPQGTAERAGVQPGDRVRTLYDYRWEQIDTQLWVFPLAWTSIRSVPMTLERQGRVVSYALTPDLPSVAFQLEKVTAFILALICWLTGYLLGLVRRHDPPGAPGVAWFWMGVGGIVGCYTFASYGSYPLAVALQWLLLMVVTPAAVALHTWFPVRLVLSGTAQRATRWLVGALLVGNGLLLAGIVAWRVPLVVVMDWLSTVVPAGLALAFVASGIVLWFAYRQTASAHVRRQIRLPGFACFFVALLWLVLRTLPALVGHAPLLPDSWIDLLSGLVPLAYLVGGITPDLYRLDRVLAWLALHVSTTLLLILGIAGVVMLLQLQGPLTVMWMALSFVVLYRPLQTLGLRLLPAQMRPPSDDTPLQNAAAALATTLDPAPLVAALCHGVQATFSHPPMAFYQRTGADAATLTLVCHDRLQLPPTIAPGPLTAHLRQPSPVIESRILRAALAGAALDAELSTLLYQPGIVLWCPIRHGHGQLLGLLLLGMRGDLDPYRDPDVRELARLLAAADLAFTNSAAYAEQALAEQTIRQLFQRLQQVRDATAAAIARELHDEIINVTVRLNIESLERLAAQVQDPAAQDEVRLVLAGEQTLAQTLRQICDQLHPTGLDDPLGLPVVLHRQVNKAQATWSGVCQFVTDGTPCPIDPAVQREVLRIKREALTNAIKHAAASAIIVQLAYPRQPGGLVEVTIQDNGRGPAAIRVTPDHWGVQNMRESARAAGEPWRSTLPDGPTPPAPGAERRCAPADGSPAMAERVPAPATGHTRQLDRRVDRSLQHPVIDMLAPYRVGARIPRAVDGREDILPRPRRRRTRIRAFQRIGQIPDSIPIGTVLVVERAGQGQRALYGRGHTFGQDRQPVPVHPCHRARAADRTRNPDPSLNQCSRHCGPLVPRAACP